MAIAWDTILSELDSVNFGFLKFGYLCNASESNAFTSARCHIKKRKNQNGQLYALKFIELFQAGCELLKDNTSQTQPVNDNTALKKLKDFKAVKGKALCTAKS